MARLVVLYPQPIDPETFERRYREEHAPMVEEKMPGLRAFAAGRVVDSPSYAHFAELTFDTVDDLRGALESVEGKAIVNHAVEISTGGPLTVLVVEDNR